MNEEFIANVEMVVYKMIEEGKITLQKTINDNGDLRISLNCYLKDEEPNEYIRKMTKEILHCWYFYKTDIYDDKEKIDYITQILKTIKYNDYL